MEVLEHHVLWMGTFKLYFRNVHGMIIDDRLGKSREENWKGILKGI